MAGGGHWWPVWWALKSKFGRARRFWGAVGASGRGDLYLSKFDLERAKLRQARPEASLSARKPSTSGTKSDGTARARNPEPMANRPGRPVAGCLRRPGQGLGFGRGRDGGISDQTSSTKPGRRTRRKLAESRLHHGNPFAESEAYGAGRVGYARPARIELMNAPSGVLDRAHPVAEGGQCLGFRDPPRQPAGSNQLTVQLDRLLDDLSRQLDDAVDRGGSVFLRPPATGRLRPRTDHRAGEVASGTEAAVQRGGHAGAPQPRNRCRGR